MHNTRNTAHGGLHRPMRNTKPMRAAAALALAFIALAAAAHAASPEQLLTDLAGADELARARARQLLPYESVRIAPELCALLAHEDEVVWRAAYNVLADFTNTVAKKGRERQRAYLTDQLMALLAPEQSAHLKRQALRLLPVAVPEGHDCTPMAALLTDPELREPARAALVDTGTPEAAAALRTALSASDPAFQAALLDGLTALRDRETVALAASLAASGSPEVRAAAARALAWTGDPAHQARMQSVVTQATAETRHDAEDAFLCYLDALMVRGGAWDRGIALYQWMADAAASVATRDAAIMGMARFGDETVIPVILATVLRGADARRQEAVLVPAFEQVKGTAAARALRDVYPSLPESVRLPMIEMFGRRGDADLAPVVIEAAKSADDATRIAGLRALGAITSPDALEVLVAAAQSASDEERALAMASLRNLGRELQQRGDAAGAVAAYTALYRGVDDPGLKREALRGLAAAPHPESIALLIEAADDEALRPEAVAALIAVGENQASAGNSEAAMQAFQRVLELDNSIATVNRITPRMAELGAAVDAKAQLGIVANWRIAGPFAWESPADWETRFVGEPNEIDFGAAYQSGDDSFTWKTVASVSDFGLVDLATELGQHDQKFAYAYTEIEVDAAQDVVVRMGSDDGYRLWINGELVTENRVDRGLAPDSDAADAKLVAGVNRILLKVSQGAGGWAYCLRLTQPDGKGVAFRERLAK